MEEVGEDQDSSPNSSGKPMLLVTTVDIGNGRAGKIELRFGDNPEVTLEGKTEQNFLVRPAVVNVLYDWYLLRHLFGWLMECFFQQNASYSKLLV